MGDKSLIEWTDATWNPIRARNKTNGRVGHFCTKVSAACTHCYAERWNVVGRGGMGTLLPYQPQSLANLELFVDDRTLSQPMRWRRPRRIFPCSMTDLFAEFHGVRQIASVFAAMAFSPHHRFQVLTKRAERMRRLMFDPTFESEVYDCMEWIAAQMDYSENWLFDGLPFPHVALGVTVEDSSTISRVDHLIDTPAACRFVSVEPLFGSLLLDWRLNTGLIDQVIVGGESGSHARPTHPADVRRIRDDCESAGVAFFFKQWGEWAPIDQTTAPNAANYRSHEFDDGVIVHRVGKKKAGRTLDGKLHDAQPPLLTMQDVTA